MPPKKKTRSLDAANTASIRKEMQEPRMARSARIMQNTLDSARVPDQPRATVPGTVGRVIPASRPNQPEKVQISLRRSDPRYRDLRIVNSLTNESGDHLKLVKGARVDFTVAAKPKP